MKLERALHSFPVWSSLLTLGFWSFFAFRRMYLSRFILLTLKNSDCSDKFSRKSSFITIAFVISLHSHDGNKYTGYIWLTRSTVFFLTRKITLQISKFDVDIEMYYHNVIRIFETHTHTKKTISIAKWVSIEWMKSVF